MSRVLEFIVDKRKLILVVFSLATLVGMVLWPSVVINYDTTLYLPADRPTSQAIARLDQEFGLLGLAQVMAEKQSIMSALALETQLEQIDGVEEVVWLSDFVDLAVPASQIDQELLKRYFWQGRALFQVIFEENDHSLATGSAIEAIKQLDSGRLTLRGPAIDAYRTRQAADSEVSMIILFVAPLFLAILFLSTNSWIEPLLFIVTIGSSILINMGTNLFFGDISYITQASAGLLQFAVTMDYSIFLLHRFSEERAKGIDTRPAMLLALKHSLSAISASSLTTIAGFVALMFMRYSIGLDMGMVLAKGVALSFVAVMTLLPALIMQFEGALLRTAHRPFLPDLAPYAKTMLKMRALVLIVILAIPIAYLAQGANDFIYGSGDVAGQGDIEVGRIFGPYNPLVVLVPGGDVAREALLSQTLRRLANVSHIESLSALIEGGIPREVLPTALIDNFSSENYSRIVVYINAATESAEAFQVVDATRHHLEQLYPDRHYLAGTSSAIQDIREVVEQDFSTINTIAILAVGFIILGAFRSLALPFILVLVIQSSIWINMAIPYFVGAPLIFIGYMIVSAVQLGATIDYAILLSSRYMEHRRRSSKKEAAIRAVADAGGSIITSGAIMGAAGFTLGYISGVPGIASLGMLVGRGALLSVVLVLTLLPHLLVLGDSLIKITTWQHQFVD